MSAIRVSPALFLADYSSHVHMILRSGDLGKSMSDYLVQRIKACDNIQVHYHCRVSALRGNGRLEAFELETKDGNRQTVASSNLFIFIGASPCTQWVSHLVATDPKGFIITGKDIKASSISGFEPQSL